MESQGEKQVKTIKEHGKQLSKSITFAENDSLPPSRKYEYIRKITQ